MAELINNVKMRLILPNNDQESFVNAINYNFHQLANIANHVDAKRGEKGEQGLPGAQGHDGQKGDRGPGIFTFVGDSSSIEAYNDFVNKNGISDGDVIMYNGVIYNYDKTPENMDDYINDHSGEDGKNRYVNTDMSGDIETKVKKVLSEDIAGSMTYRVINDGGIAFVTPKAVNDMDKKYSGDNARKSMTAVFTTNLDPDETKNNMDDYVNNYSINSLCNGANTVNLRLGYEKYADKNFATINFEEQPIDDESSLIFDLMDNDGEYDKHIAKYTFNAGGESIVSISKEDSDKSIKIGDNFIFKKRQSSSVITSNGGVFVENSDGGNLIITNYSNSPDNSYIRISKQSKTTLSYISIDSYSISIKNYHPGTNGYGGITLNYDGTIPGSYLELDAVSIYNKRTKRINLSTEEVIKLSKNRDYISIDNNGIDICCDTGNENVTAQRSIKVNNNGVILSVDTPIADSYIKLYTVANGSSSIEVSSSKYIISCDSFDNIKNKSGLRLTGVNIDGDYVSSERTYLASNETLALASNNNILLFPGKQGYVNLYAKQIKFLDNDASVVYYGDLKNFIPPCIGSNDSINFKFYRFWDGRVICITAYGVNVDKNVYYENIEDIEDSETKFELNKLWSYALNYGLYLGDDCGDIKGNSYIISIPLSSITTDASFTAGEHVIVGASKVSNKRYLQVFYVHRPGVGSGPNKFMGQLFYI